VELRLRIEQGIRTGHSEIHLRYLYSTDAPSSEWPEQSSNTDVEAALLLEIGRYLKDDLDRVAFSKLAQEISTQPKAWLERRGAEPSVLRLRLDFGRAWAMVVSALANAEVNVTESDRDSAVMSVDMERDLLEGDEGGFFNWFSGSEQLVIRLKPWREGFDVGVFQGDAPAPNEISERVLLLIQDYAT
jgi:outer membrane protein assembly factor BamC